MTDLTTLATKLGREAAARARAIAETHPLAQKTKDAVYTAVGFGVLSTQRASAAVKKAPSPTDGGEFSASVKRAVAEISGTLKRQSTWLDDQLTKTAHSIDEAVSPIEQHLPGAVRDLSAAARTFAEKLAARARHHESGPDSDAGDSAGE